MGLPDQTELLKIFASFLFEAGLSAVSVKNYLSDLRHFLAFCASLPVHGTDEGPTVKDIFRNINQYLDQYLQNQKATFTPQSTTARRLASIRRFSTFLSVKFNISNIFTDQSVSNYINTQKIVETNQTTSPSALTNNSGTFSDIPNRTVLTSTKILDQFRTYLEKEKKSHSTVKNYVSDLNHFFLWTAKQTPFTDQNLVNILSPQLLSTYVTYLKLSHTGTSVINRRQSSIKKLAKFCFDQKYIPKNPFELKAVAQSLAPLAWLERLTFKSKKTTVPAKKSRLALIYDRYSSLSWTPYLNLALLVLATTAIAIFAYNQIISQARPSAAATALTPPKRQLSFQGRLTDTGGTPITTAVSVVFKLWNQISGGTETSCTGAGGENCLYTTSTCSITPDQDGIFNTLIGDGVCGAEINSSVFTDNRDVFLQIQVGAETLTPRQQIATVGYALNSETLQGYPASASATINTVPVMDNFGRIVLGQTNPSIVATSSSGIFTIKGDTLSFQTNLNSGGDIILQPDALGSGQILGIGGTTTEDTFRITNSNLTTGSLISGYVGNDLPTGKLISLTSGSTETDRFWVKTDGTTSINAAATNSAFLINQTGTGDLISASISGVTKFTVTNGGNVNITGQYLINGVPFSGSNWQRTAGSLAPNNITDSINIGSIATASALVHLAGTAGENSFINTGKFGVGMTNPSFKLDVIEPAGSTWASRIYNTSATAGNGLIVRAGNDTTNKIAEFRDTADAPKVTILGNGAVGIGVTNPGYKLDVAGDLNLQAGVRANGTFGSSGQVLSTTGTIAQWVDPASLGSNFWQRTAGSLAPINITDSFNLGSTATASAFVHLAGTAGENSFINTGNFGVGTISPTAGKLQVAGGNIVVDAGSGLDTAGAGALAIGNVTATAINIGTTTNARTITIGNILGATGVNVNTGTAGTTYTTTNGIFNLSTGTGAISIGADAVAKTITIGNSTGTTAISLNSGSGNLTLNSTEQIILNSSKAAGGTVTEAISLKSTADLGATDEVLQIGDSAADLVTVLGNGNVGVGVTNPAYRLDVSGDFNLTGAFRDNGDPGTPGQILSSTGTGTQWIVAPTGSGTSPWNWSAGVIYPFSITDAVNLGNAATASATVHLAGNPGDNSFVNTGNFGIGLTNPAYKLDVNGDINLSGGIRASGSFGTSGQILSTTGTSVQWINPTTGGSGDNFWTIANGAIYPVNSTLDAFIGGTSTASAKFAFINVNSGTPIASISSTVAGVNTYLTGDGNLGTTSRQTLTIGNSTTYDSTGNVLINQNGTGNVGIGVTDPTSTLTVAGTVNLNDSVNSATNINTGSSTGSVTVGGNANTVAINSSSWDITTTGVASGLTGLTSSGNITFSGLTANRGVFTTTGGLLTTSAASQYLIDSLSDETGTGVAVFNNSPTFTTQITSPIVNGSAAANGILTLQGNNNATGNTAGLANLVFKVGDSAGTTAMTITNNGNVGIGDTNPNSMLTVGNGDLFQVNSSGAIASASGITSTGTITFASLGTGIVHSSSLGVLSSSGIDLSTSDVTGILPIARGGTNNDSIISPYVSGKFLTYDGTRFTSSAYSSSDFEFPLTFSNGLTRTVNAVTLGGTLTQDTNIDTNGNDIVFSGTGNFGVGVASPSAKFDVSGFFIVDTVNGRVGIGTSTPTVALDIAGTTSTISNAAGDITLNAASGFINFSGDSLNNFLDATLSGRLQLGLYPTVGLPSGIAGMMVYDTTSNIPVYNDGSAWMNMGSFFDRTTTGIIYPSVAYNSLNIGGTPSASASALIRLSSTNSQFSFFMNPVAFGFNTGAITDPTNTAVEVEGDILPHTTGVYNLGVRFNEWSTLSLDSGIYRDGTLTLSTASHTLEGGVPWNIVSGARIGDATALPAAYKLYVSGDATVSGNIGATSGFLFVGGTSKLMGDVTVGGGAGKINVGTVDPPYTINGEKYATYMASMIGVKEETIGHVNVTDYVKGLGYRALIELDNQQKGSDLWLFSKTTQIKSNLDQLSVLLTAEGQGKTWYEVDHQNNILAIYSSTPTRVNYRLSAPRFDAANWTNTRTSEFSGFVLTDEDLNANFPGTGLLSQTVDPQLIAEVDNTYSISVNGVDNKEVSSFFKSLIANLEVGAQTVTDLFVKNLTVGTKLVSPIADIDSLRTIDATISGTLYADNIKSRTVDALTDQLNILNENYASAAGILANLQAKYTSYDSLLGQISEASASGDPLLLSPLATTSAFIPADLALNSLSVHTIYSNDIMANGSVFAQALNSFDGDLYIQPTGDKPVHLLANLMTLYPNGKVVVNGDLLVTGVIYANGLDTRTATVSGTLALGRGESATNSGNLITLFDDNGQMVGSVNASGSANFGQLITGGLVIASGSDNQTATVSSQTNSNTTIGVGTIATGSAEVVIANNKVSSNTLIYITPISNTANRVLYVKSKQTGVGFTVAIPGNPNPVSQEISFNYWLVETK